MKDIVVAMWTRIRRQNIISCSWLEFGNSSICGFSFVQQRRSVRRRVMHVYRFGDNCMEMHVLFSQCITDTIYQTHMPDTMKESLSIWFNPRLCLSHFPIIQSTFFLSTLFYILLSITVPFFILNPFYYYLLLLYILH